LGTIKYPFKTIAKAQKEVFGNLPPEASLKILLRSTGVHELYNFDEQHPIFE